MRPEITIVTRWRASAPNEIESEIIEPQEDVLAQRAKPAEAGILIQLRQRATINLEFAIGTDMNRALIEVMNRLNQVPRYPGGRE